MMLACKAILGPTGTLVSKNLQGPDVASRKEGLTT